MKAIILSVGDELVLGQTVDTNSAWLSQQLAAVGCDIAAHATVPDHQEAIAQVIRMAAEEADYLIISGGIGPTPDDLTRQALADVMGTPLELNAIWLARLEAFFNRVGRPMPEMNQIQAMIPRGAELIENTAGTAAGIRAVLKARGSNRNCEVFVMPGVPKEMKLMFTRDVLPHIQEIIGGAAILSRTLHTFGLGESAVAGKLGELMNRDRNPLVGTTVSGGIVSVRVNARMASREVAQSELDRTVAACRQALGPLIFGADDETLAQVVGLMLKLQKETICTAESCTGGLLAKMLTDISGSSNHFKQGWITYTNRAKTERLGVSENIINCHGAVSEPVVDAMAKAARRLAKSTYALAISGVAGPTGGTPAKPVGTVCIALASDDAVQARTFNFSGDREMVRDRAAKMALAMLRFKLLDTPMPF